MKSTSPAGPTRAEPNTVQARESSQDRVELVEQLRGLFDRAAESVGGPDDVWLSLGGLAIRCRFAGTAMSEVLLPALAHLRTDPQPNAELTIRIWDSASTSTPVVVPPWGPDAYLEYGVIRGYFGDGFFTTFDWGTRALNVVSAESGEAFLWMPDAEKLGPPDRAAPMRTLLNLCMTNRDTQLVHGAAIGREGGCVLLVGRSGSGKSSTALSCLGSDLRHLSEDYCLISEGEPPEVWSLYNSAKVGPEALDRLPGVREMLVSMPVTHYEKALLDLNAHMPEKLLRSAPLHAIALPRIGTAVETTTRPCSAGAALAAVAPNTILQLPGNGEPLLRFLSSLVRSVPCYQLDLGTEPDLIAPAIAAMLDE